MKPLLVFVSMFVLSLGLLAQPSSTGMVERQSYADRNAQELRQIRQQLDAIARNTPLAGQQRLAPLYDALLAAEEALAEMRIASELDFQARRADMENAKARAARLWREFRINDLGAASPEQPASAAP
jgi:hypothetical protein